MTALLALLAGPVLAGPADLPERPERPSKLEPGECEETGIIDGAPVDPLEDCSGLVIPLSQWRYLESANSWGAAVNDLWDIRQIQHDQELLALESEIDRLSAPIPWTERQSTWILLGSMSTAAILIGYNWSIRSGGQL